jgi:hypothetical protein
MIEIKIIAVIFTSLFACWVMAVPRCKFATWGTKKFGSYSSFLLIIALIHIVPIIVLYFYHLATI